MISMVVRKQKKVRKYRGYRSYGYGSHKKHRGGGSRGGRGNAGLHKHKWSFTVKYAKDHFGKVGFRTPGNSKVKTINLEELDRISDRLVDQKKAERVGEIVKINVTKLGYQKVLGSGRLSKPLIIQAKQFSKSAEKKLQEVGGKAEKI